MSEINAYVSYKNPNILEILNQENIGINITVYFPDNEHAKFYCKASDRYQRRLIKQCDYVFIGEQKLEKSKSIQLNKEDVLFQFPIEQMRTKLQEFEEGHCYLLLNNWTQCLFWNKTSKFVTVHIYSENGDLIQAIYCDPMAFVVRQINTLTITLSEINIQLDYLYSFSLKGDTFFYGDKQIFELQSKVFIPSDRRNKLKNTTTELVNEKEKVKEDEKGKEKIGEEVEEKWGDIVERADNNLQTNENIEEQMENYRIFEIQKQQRMFHTKYNYTIYELEKIRCYLEKMGFGININIFDKRTNGIVYQQ